MQQTKFLVAELANKNPSLHEIFKVHYLAHKNPILSHLKSSHIHET
jgi:hypothetical protein